jgi:hypothetical protein
MQVVEVRTLRRTSEPSVDRSVWQAVGLDRFKYWLARYVRYIVDRYRSTAGPHGALSVGTVLDTRESRCRGAHGLR